MVSMLNFDNLVSNLNKDTKVEEYLQDFFVSKNFKQYKISNLADSEQIKAIKTMFTSRKSLTDRIDDAFDCDPFCVEAMFSYLMLKEDVYIQMRFNEYYSKISGYATFDDYERKCYIEILNFFVDFLLDAGNITKAIEVEKMIIRLTNNYTSKSISRLSYAYFTLEDADGFYRLYTNVSFDLYGYLLLIITLLKHDDELRAQEVLLDMYEHNEYGTYLDHVWDLDDSDPKQKEFADIVDECYNDINAVPTFFFWVNKIREKYEK